MDSRPALAPGPRGWLLLGNLPALRNDVLGLLTQSARDHGDIVRFQIGPLTVHLLNHPELIDRVLVGGRDQYDKQSRSTAALRRICGESLLTADGEAWRWRRRAIQPAFHRTALDGFAHAMRESTRELVAAWESAAKGGRTVDAAADLMRLTYRIVSRCLFGADADQEADQVGAAMQVLVTHAFDRWKSLLPIPDGWPTPAQLRFRRALAEVDTIVAGLVARRLARGEPGSDLLGLLLSASDPETATRLTPEQVRNEAITFLLAGHETTAIALAWTLHLLSRNPETADLLAAEPPGSTAICDRILSESLRLYPPIWAIERRAITDDTLRGFHIPRNSSVILSPYTLHRHPAFWEEPERFDPDRFARNPDPPAYLPFGAGPRACVGREFALAEARTILPAIARTLRFHPANNAAIRPDPAITLRIRNALPLQLQMR